MNITVVTTSIVLGCAVLASLATGVLLAYGLCLSMLAAFRMHAIQVRSQHSQKLTGAQVRVLEG